MAHSIARQTQEEQGWTDETLLDVVLDYISNQDSNDAFQDYLSGRCAEEEDLCTPEEVPTQVEYDLKYSGGDYSSVGEIIIVQVRSNETVEEAFKRETGHDPVHIIHYTEDFDES